MTGEISGGADPAVLVHAGLHKSGTTWLQHRYFRPNAPARFVYTEERVRLRGLFCMPDLPDFDPGAARAELSDLMDEAAARAVPLILSDEALAGFPFHEWFLRGVSLARIARTFARPVVLVTIREQVAMIHSAYGHYLRAGYSASLAQFLHQPEGRRTRFFHPILNLAFYDYARLLDTLEAEFGADNVLVHPMEAMIRDPAGLVARLSGRLGHDLPPCDPTAGESVTNPAWSELARTVERHTNRLVAQDARWQDPDRRIVKPAMFAARISRLTPGALQRRMRDRNLSTIRAAVGGRYAASNRAVADRIGIDLGDYGYAM